MSEENILVVFKVISNFVSELAEFFAGKNRSLKLYRRLLKHVTFEDEEHMKKHIEIFKAFSVSNREALEARDKTLIKEPLIKFSDKVFLNMETIFNQSPDKETSSVIWQHLLTISAYLDPESKAKEILKTEKVKKKLEADSSKEANFLTDVIGKIQQTVDTGAATDPKDVVSNILSSGVFNDVLSSINSSVEDGSLDLSKLMNTVQGMVAGLGGEGDGMPDLSSIGQMLGGLGGLGSPPKIEPVEDDA
jgi:hypothetical protein